MTAPDPQRRDDDATVSFGHEAQTSGGESHAPADGIHPEISGCELLISLSYPAFLVGGFGRVYRAKNADGVLVGVKVPRPEVSGAAALDRWAQECSMSRAFPSHENVVRFYPREVARWPDGRVTDALVMEWLDGARGLVRYANDVELDKVQRIELLLQAVEGVAWMHSHGITHCDLKSDNLLVIERLGRPIVKVTDFGGTRAPQRLDPKASAYTQWRAAPEVATGDPAAITPRADVYSLCKECAALVGGPAALKPPDSGVMTDWRAPTLGECLGLADPGLDEIIATGTRNEPRDRFASAEELRMALSEYQPPLVERMTRAVERWLWPRAAASVGRGARNHARNRLPWALLAMLLLGTLLSFRAASVLLTSGFKPSAFLPVEAPEELTGVVVVREKSADGLATLAQRAGIPGVNLEAPVTKRLAWAAVIRQLAAQRPSAIALDVAFVHSDDPVLNRVITDVVAEVTHGPNAVPVVLATEDYLPGSPEQRSSRPLIRGLQEAGAQWGCMNLSMFFLIGPGLAIPQGENAIPRLPLSVAVVKAVKEGHGSGAAPLAVHVDESEVCLRFVGNVSEGYSVKLMEVVPSRDIERSKEIAGVQRDDILGVYAVGIPDDTVFASVDKDVLDLVSPEGEWKPLDVRNRVVLLAAYRADDKLDLGARSVPGVWFHAAAVQSLLSAIDAPQVSWWILLPISVAVALGLALGLPMAARVYSWCAVPIPSLRGRWPKSSVSPAGLVKRWKLVTVTLVLLCAAVPVSVHLVGTALEQWTVSYTAAMLAWGAYVGVVAAAVAVAAAGWMGCVRRAWCLDRAN